MSSMTATHNGQRPAVGVPRPELVRLHRFSLYEKAPTITAEFGRGVFCVAGANGLGKSTFIAALNYGITGIVPQPGREFRGVDDYYKKVQPYSASFFRGRISDQDADAAQVEIVLRAGPHRFRLVRGMFNPVELRELEITDVETGEAVIGGASELDPGGLHDQYAASIVDDCGLESFAQLVFLQHFVLTFDERRELLFWGARRLPPALFIAFGLDAAKARRADQLQERVRGADSLARNYSWQASDWKRQLDNLERAAGDVEPEDTGVAAEHVRLQEEQAEAAAEAERTSNALVDAQLRIAERSAQLRADREAYDELWALRLRGHGHPGMHPLVTTTLAEERCSLCGTEGTAVTEHVRDELAAERCPLCASALTVTTEAGTDPAAERLRELAELDGKIDGHVQAIAATEATASKLQAQLTTVRERLDGTARRINEFERANELALLRSSGNLDVVAERYRGSMADQLQRKERELKRRDEARSELRALQRELVQAYDIARERFVPTFTRLAEQFLGLPIGIELEARQNDVTLLLTVQGDRRREEDALSESQRFFLDIALRMALVTELSGQDAPGVMYIDTPEGSLDIAYEARAGDMFGTFVHGGYGLVMTANINTSQLLERLAASCGPELMHLERMTEWTVLTDVQASEEQLFDDAYNQIERALEQSR
jgi:DNA repair exonuclease SbcCD ATPase subunit